MGLIMENAMREEKEMLIDLGYLNEESIKRVEALQNFGIGKKNFCCDIMNRMVVRLPKTKQKAVLETFPIVEGGNYWQTTHHWAEDTEREQNRTV